MIPCLFASDLHGHTDRYEKLFSAIQTEKPAFVFLAGDLYPSALVQAPQGEGDFLPGYLAPRFSSLREEMGEAYPEILLILGNDDPRTDEDECLRGDREGLWHYLHTRHLTIGKFSLFGYAFVPPTPFPWKDWERYDVSRYTPPGGVSPEEGWRTVDVSEHWVRYGTIKGDLEDLAGEAEMERAVFLFHTPPHETSLDRAALDGKMVDYVPLDVHVGSIAVRRFIEARQPLLTLHGHIHESAQITGSWRDKLGRTHMFSAAHDGPELALVRFDLDDLDTATRALI